MSMLNALVCALIYTHVRPHVRRWLWVILNAWDEGIVNMELRL